MAKGYVGTNASRKSAKHTARYGMTPSEWAKYKKTNKAEAHQLRMKVQNPAAKNK